jgi:Transposase, Mutator family
VLGCRWQRCTVHFLRDMLGHVARTQQPLVSGAIRGIFTATSATQAGARLGYLSESSMAMVLAGSGHNDHDQTNPDHQEVPQLTAP